ncbi:MAG: hypothetical protein K2R98_06200, partial [Gemmataceae bacterium]|nr:hypothetical protein [Gemmataceae bacterium]
MALANLTKHVRWAEDGIRILGFTLVGRATVAALQLSDDPDALEVRSNWVVADWHLKTGQWLRRFGPFQAAAAHLAYAPDGKTLVTSAWDGKALLRDLATGKETGQLVGHDRWLAAMAFSTDGKHFAAVDGGKGTLHVWDAASSKEVRRLEKRRETSAPGPRQRKGALSASGREQQPRRAALLARRPAAGAGRRRQCSRLGDCQPDGTLPILGAPAHADPDAPARDDVIPCWRVGLKYDFVNPCLPYIPHGGSRWLVGRARRIFTGSVAG